MIIAIVASLSKKTAMANLYNEEIQKIYIDIESGDLPDFSAKAEEATLVGRRMYDLISSVFL